jgi:hypothetical protein
MALAQRTKHVFNIDATTSIHGRSAVRTAACVEDPNAIRPILA